MLVITRPMVVKNSQYFSGVEQICVHRRNHLTKFFRKLVFEPLSDGHIESLLVALQNRIGQPVFESTFQYALLFGSSDLVLTRERQRIFDYISIEEGNTHFERVVHAREICFM